MDNSITRRDFLKFSAAAVGVAVAGGIPLAASAADAGAIVQKPLPYAYDALEPYIDAQTMEIHFSRHHAGYVNNLLAAIKGTPMELMTIEQILGKGPRGISTAVRNNGGGHHNHELFWSVMKPGGGGEPTGALRELIIRDFGSLQAFKDRFEAEARNRFGSGWSWLVSDGNRLRCYSTANQDSPVMEGRTPILGLDVWEHAYYLKYQNRRADYIKAFWNVVNWDKVDELCRASMSG